VGKIKKDKFIKILEKNKNIGLDSNIFIYHLDSHEKYSPLTEIIFTHIERGKNKGFTSSLSYLETAVPSMRFKKLIEVANIKSFFLNFPHLQFFAPDLEILDKVLYFRSFYNLKSIDAVQIATALEKNCNLFITNDKKIPALKEIKILYLEDYIN